MNIQTIGFFCLAMSLSGCAAFDAAFPQPTVVAVPLPEEKLASRQAEVEEARQLAACLAKTKERFAGISFVADAPVYDLQTLSFTKPKLSFRPKWDDGLQHKYVTRVFDDKQIESYFNEYYRFGPVFGRIVINEANDETLEVVEEVSREFASSSNGKFTLSWERKNGLLLSSIVTSFFTRQGLDVASGVKGFQGIAPLRTDDLHGGGGLEIRMPVITSKKNLLLSLVLPDYRGVISFVPEAVRLIPISNLKMELCLPVHSK